MTQNWSGEWSVGLDVLDNEHSTILGLIGELAELSSQKGAVRQIGAIVASVAAYTEHHFQREENVMSAVDFPGLTGHRLLHARLKDRTNIYLRQSLENPAMVDIESLHGFLKEWWEHHILREDMAYKPFLENNPKAREAATAA